MSPAKLLLLTSCLIAPITLANAWQELLQSEAMLFGVAVEPRYLDDVLYQQQLLSTFNAITPENVGKWESIHPKKEVYDFSGMDKIVHFAKENNLQVRGHTLVWHNQNPAWLTSGVWLEEEANAILKDHIDTVVSRYKGEVVRWDVVNEALADNGDMRGTYWYNLFGENYLNMAFEWAHQADPEAILYYNDYAISDCGDKADGAYQLMKRLVGSGVPVHGIGFQGHFEVANPVDLQCFNDNINRMGALGLEVQITELDIRVNMSDLDPALQNKQSVQFRAMVGLLATNKYLNGITVWGLSDAHSWVPSWFAGQGSALLFDEAMQPKPVLAVVKNSLQAFMSGSEAYVLPKRRDLTLRSFPVFGADEWEAPLTADSIATATVWQSAERYPLAFNQLQPLRMAINNAEDLFAQWQVAYHGTQLYGHLTRQDDITTPVNTAAIWENDCVEVFVQWAGKLYQFRAQVGGDFADIGFPGYAQAVWRGNGQDMYFIIDFPDITELKGQTIAWNIALADVDTRGGAREAQLYPVPGTNRSWVGKDLAELHFTGQNRPPSQDAKGVVAAFVANYSESGALPASLRGQAQYPLSFGHSTLKHYPTAMLTWRATGLSAHLQLPEGLTLVESSLSIRLPSRVIDVLGGDHLEVAMDTAMVASQFYRVALSVTVQDGAGVEHTLSAAPKNGFVDVNTQ